MTFARVSEMQRKEKRAVRPGSRAVCYTTLQYGTALPVAGKTELVDVMGV